MFKVLEWKGKSLRIIDQTLLPRRIRYREIQDTETLVEAIRAMRIRGAPAIGVAGAYGMVLEAQRIARRTDLSVFKKRLRKTAERLLGIRPTAVNLSHTLRRMERILDRSKDTTEAIERLLQEASTIQEEERERCERIAAVGAQLFQRNGMRVLTLCNTGSLATGGGMGTAHGVILQAFRKGKVQRVYVSETRPLLQGGRLALLEFLEEGVPATLIPDGASGHLLSRGEIDLILVGADRIVRNGDTANKIGTLPLAVLAHHYGVPFYVAAPWTTLDLTIKKGEEIPLEVRSPEEVLTLLGFPIAPKGADALNVAFDITPGSLVTAFITDQGMIHPPYEKNIPVLQGTD